ncbi:N-acetylglutamate synthase, GNAT family [bacterium A37T11]|nr:N-acetylglutamate synthase, GNAT family [bacterium A37T11]
MPLQIVPLHNDSADAIIDIILSIQQKEFHIPITLEDQPDLLEIDQFYHTDGGGFWGAYIDGQLVGTISLIKYSSHSGAIRKMFVKKEFRGKKWGAAQQLLNTLVNYAKNHQITDIYLGTIHILHAAIRFYERNHFEQIAKKDLPTAFPVMGADNTFYHLTVSKWN